MSMHIDLASRYASLWETNFPAVSRGDIEIDHNLSNPASDRRRGLTLIFRPSLGITKSIVDFLSRVHALEPDQYVYPVSDMHFTVLSLFTATVNHQSRFAAMCRYMAIVQETLKGMSAFSIQVTGLTLSRGAVMVCGFPDSDALNDLRTNLRKLLTREGLIEGLDQRYTLVMAHSTILRFAAPLRDPQTFATCLEENRFRNFGSCHVKEMHLVKNDWYMSRRHLQVIATYPLPLSENVPSFQINK
jgi:2'-5' RNA ligase